MPDYLHALRFGTFIAPVVAPVQHAVDMARVSEDAGLDLVTFQDHPYNPSLLDTWTLMSWVAAKTSRVHLSGNVVNVAMRPPSVLARAAASLDLLSSGRVALGLGAGYFWDAVATMGGPRLTNGQAVTGLEQAIDILRALWDTSAPGPVTAGGEFYHVAGAQRGPTPAHDIPIWLGAYKPRMLRLIGRKADGWLPALPILKSGIYGGDSIALGNDIIDEAALAAGRDPRQITRLLNVTPGESATDLVKLALDDGVSVFILLGADDRGTIEHFAALATEVRERVAVARS